MDAYREAVRANVQTWNERIYDPPPTSDPHYPAFSPYQPQIHEPVRATMLAEAKKQEVNIINFYDPTLCSTHTHWEHFWFQNNLSLVCMMFHFVIVI